MLPRRRTVYLLLSLVAQTCDYFSPNRLLDANLPSASIICTPSTLPPVLPASPLDCTMVQTVLVYDNKPRQWDPIREQVRCKICRVKWCKRRGIKRHEDSCQSALDDEELDRIRSTWANLAPTFGPPAQVAPSQPETDVHAGSHANVNEPDMYMTNVGVDQLWDNEFAAEAQPMTNDWDFLLPAAELHPFTQQISDNALNNMLPSPPTSQLVPDLEQESLDRILIQWHPSAMRKDDNIAFSAYNPDPDLTHIAWTTTAESGDYDTFAAHAPFNTELDFEIADFLNDTGLTEKAGKRFFKLLRKVSMNPDDWTMQNWKTYTKTMNAASLLVDEFKSETFEAKHIDDDFKFTVYYRDMKSWCMDILNEPSLKPYLDFDARKMFTSTAGSAFQQFWREPTTGELWWNIQDHIFEKYGSNNVKPVCLILYTDKSRLSSFGTVQAYPIVARLANLPDHIRNNNGLGGGRVVGFLPIIDEQDRYKNATSWANFKREVEHRALEIFLRALVDWHEEGPVPYQFSNEIQYNVLPYVLIYSCDYEEAILLSLTRGVGGSRPCVFCLAPRDQLINNRQNFEMRRWDKEKEMYEKSSSDSLYAQQGLRRVKNAFWKLPFFDLHKALSFDTLHAFFSGLGDRLSKHLIARVSVRDVKEGSGPKKGPHYGTKVDNNIAVFPRWPGLNHFKGVTQFIHKMSDGTKRDHLARQLMFCLHGVILRTKDPIGYILLKAFRKYQEMVLYASLSVQTIETREGGEAASLAYSDLIQEYSSRSSAEEGSNVNWNFPKNHIFKHFWQLDISLKGVSKNMSTKINEAMHRPLKFIYQNRTNFKNIEAQITRFERWSDGMAFILHRIDWYKRLKAEDTDSEDTPIEADDDDDDATEAGQVEDDGRVAPNLTTDDHRVPGCTHATVHGARGTNPKTKHEVGMRSIVDVETAGDAAYRGLVTKLQNFVEDAMPYDNQYQHPQDTQKFVRRGFADMDEIRIYSSLKVSYASEVNWKMEQDIVRCISTFHSAERFDCVLYRDEDDTFAFGRLLRIIRCFPFGVDAGTSMVGALVQPYDADLLKSREHTTLDQDLCFYRVRSRSRKDSKVIPVASIVRGALLVEDVYKIEGYLHQDDFQPATDGRKDYLVVDIIDEDMFIRMKTLPYKGRRSDT